MSRQTLIFRSQVVILRFSNVFFEVLSSTSEEPCRWEKLALKAFVYI